MIDYLVGTLLFNTTYPNIMATYNYQLEEHDYHTHLLYTISKSSNANKVRANIRLLMTISFLLFAFIAYGNGSKNQMVYFIFLAIVSFIVMPFYTRWSYKKAYLKHVRLYYKDRMSEPTSITFNDRTFSISDNHGTSDLNTSEIEQINEIKDYYFLKLKSGQSIIIPLLKIENREVLSDELHAISTALEIPLNNETNWIWK